jgi:hypothetical protein
MATIPKTLGEALKYLLGALRNQRAMRRSMIFQLCFARRSLPIDKTSAEDRKGDRPKKARATGLNTVLSLTSAERDVRFDSSCRESGSSPAAARQQP